MFFDFDGVLAESADIKADAFRELYAEFGNEVVEKCVAHHRYHAGISRVVKIEKYHAEHLGIELSGAELAQWVKRYSTIVESKVVNAPAVLGVDAFLRSETLPLYVISGTPEDELLRIVTARGWDEHFEEVHGSPRLKPVIIEDILARTGLARDRVLFVGDAMTDYNAAQDTDLAFLGRVAPGDENLFPEGTTLVDDLTGLSDFVRA
ncbi:HAD hydrolase-like protein [Magnetovibrio sp. PR-2]|uniref:HAD family hydrolase n=1 Tax=Magnetovibrio sp. PR-2 TaxID=3120356 RepID=UPI002FCE54A8